MLLLLERLLFRLLIILKLQLLLRWSLPGLLLRLLSTLLPRSFADLMLLLLLPSLTDTELQYLHLMLYPCYLLRLQGWDVSSWVAKILSFGHWIL
jgi:hypothetical protein